MWKAIDRDRGGADVPLSDKDDNTVSLVEPSQEPGLTLEEVSSLGFTDNKAPVAPTTLGNDTIIGDLDPASPDARALFDLHADLMSAHADYELAESFGQNASWETIPEGDFTPGQIDLLADTLDSCFSSDIVDDNVVCLANKINAPVQRVAAEYPRFKKLADAVALHDNLVRPRDIAVALSRRFPDAAKVLVNRPEMAHVVLSNFNLFDFLSTTTEANLLNFANFFEDDGREWFVRDAKIQDKKEIINKLVGGRKEEVYASSVPDGIFDRAKNHYDVGELSVRLSEVGARALAASEAGNIKALQRHLLDAAEIRRQQAMLRPANDSYALGLVGEAVESMPFTVESLKSGAVGGVIGGIVATPFGQTQTGIALGAGVANGFQEFEFQKGLNFLDFLETTTDEGGEISLGDKQHYARRAASLQAAVASADTFFTIMSLGLSKVPVGAIKDALFRRIKGDAKKELVEKASERARQKALASVSKADFERSLSSTHRLRRDLRDVFKSFGASAGGEAVEEMAQEYVGAEVKQSMKEINSPFEQADEWTVEELLRTGVVAALSGGVTGLGAASIRAAVNSSSRLIARKRFEAQSLKTSQVLVALAAHAKTKSADVNRSFAQTFGETIKGWDGQPIRTVGFDPHWVVEFFEQDGKDGYTELKGIMGEGPLKMFTLLAEEGLGATVSFEEFYANWTEYKNSKGVTLAEFIAPKAWVRDFMSREEVLESIRRERVENDLLRDVVADDVITDDVVLELVRLHGGTESASKVVPEAISRARLLFPERKKALVEALKDYKNINEEDIDLALNLAFRQALLLAIDSGDLSFIDSAASFDVVDSKVAAQFIREQSDAARAQDAQTAQGDVTAQAAPPPRKPVPPRPKKEGAGEKADEKADDDKKAASGDFGDRALTLINQFVDDQLASNGEEFLYGLSVHPNSGALGADAFLDKIGPDTPVSVFDLEGKKFLNDRLGHLVLDDVVRRMANVVYRVAPGMTAQSSTSVYAAVTAEQAKALQTELEKELHGLGVTTATISQNEAKTFVEKELKQGGHGGDVRRGMNLFAVLDVLAKRENTKKIERGERTQRKAPPVALFGKEAQKRVVIDKQKRLGEALAFLKSVEVRPNPVTMEFTAAYNELKKHRRALKRYEGYDRATPKTEKKIEKTKEQIAAAEQGFQEALEHFMQTDDFIDYQHAQDSVRFAQQDLDRVRQPIDWDAKPPQPMAVATELGLDVEDPAVFKEFMKREAAYQELAGMRDVAEEIAVHEWTMRQEAAEHPITHDEPRIQDAGLSQATKDRLAAMTRDQIVQQFFMKDGVLSWTGQQVAERLVKPVAFLSGDMSGLFDLNEAMSKAGADLVLSVLRAALSWAANKNLLTFHLHGDEIGAMVDQGYLDALDALGRSRGKSAVDHLKSYAGELVDLLGQTNFYYHNTENDTLVVVQGIGLQYGFGETFDKADVDIKEQNKARSGGKPFVQRLNKTASDQHESKPEGIASRIEVFHGLTEQQRQALIGQLVADNYFNIQSWGEEVRVSWATTYGQSQRARWATTPEAGYDATTGEGADSARNVSEHSSSVAPGGGGHRGAVFSADERRDAPDGRTDTERSVAGAGSADHGASGRLDEEGRVLFHGQKGAVRFGPTREENRRLFQVAMDPEAGVETFLHEISHIMLQQLADYSRTEKASKGIKQEVAELAKLLNFNPNEPVTTAAHERWANVVTQKFLGGVNPESESVNKSTDRVKNQYAKKFFSAAKDVEINQKLYDFLDTLFAVDERIKKAAQKANGEPLAQQLLSLSPAEYDDYLRAFDAESDKMSRSKEMTELRAKIKEVRSKYIGEFEKVRLTKLNEIRRGRGFLWRQFLFSNPKHKFMLLESDVLEQLKIVTGEVPPSLVNNVTDNPVWGFSYEKLRERLIKDFGRDITLEFGSAYTFYDELAKAPDSKGAEALAKQLAIDFITSENRKALLEEERNFERILSGLEFSPEFMNQKMTELVDLGKYKNRNGPQQKQMREAARLIAENLAPSSSNIIKWRNKANRARQKWLEKITPSASGRAGVDSDAAVRFKEEEMIASFVVNELYSNQRASEAYKTYLKKLGTKDELKRIGHLDQGVVDEGFENFGRFYDIVASLLEAVGLKSAPKNKSEVANRAGLSELDAAIEDLDARRASFSKPINVSSSIDEEPELKSQKEVLAKRDMTLLQGILDNPTRWDALTFKQQKELREFLGDIAHLKRTGRLIWFDGRAHTLDSLRKLIYAGVPISGDNNDIYLDNTKKTFGYKAAELLRSHADYVTEKTVLFNRLGEFGDALMRTMLEVEARKNELGFQFIEEFEKLLSLSDEGMKRALEEFVLPEDMLLPQGTRRELNRSWLLMMALEVGNDSNMQRLVDGFGGEMRGWTPERVMQLLNDELSDEEWLWAQRVWDLFAKMQPMTAKVYKNTTGTPMALVEPRPFKTRSGLELKGGYFPIFYNRSLSTAGLKEKMNDVELARFSVEALHMTTSQRHVKERVDAVFNSPLDLNADSVHGALASMIHYISHEEAVRNLTRMMSDSFIRKTLTARIGIRGVDAIDTMLNEFANGVDPVKQSPLAAFLSRSHIVHAIGFSLAPAIGDLPRALSAAVMGKLNMRYVIAAHAQNPLELIRFATKKSGVAKLYFENAANRYKSAREQSDLSRTKLEALHSAINSHAFDPLDWSTKYIGSVVWVSKYNEILSKTGDEASAVDAANKALVEIMPASIDWMKGEFQNQSVGRLLFAFASEFVKIATLILTGWQDARAAWRQGDRKTAAAIAIRGSLGILSLSLFSALLMGQGPGDDEELHKWALRTGIASIGNSEPFILKQLVNGAILPQFFGQRASTSQVPILATGQLTATRLRSILTRFERGEALKDLNTYMDAVELVGPAFLLPTSVIGRTIRPLLTEEENKRLDSVENPIEFLEAIIYGRKSDRGYNVFRLIGD